MGSFVSIAIFVVHWTLALLLAWRLIHKRRSVSESLAWLFVVFAIPIVGAFLYYAFGERRQSDKRIYRLESISESQKVWQRQLKEDYGSATGSSPPIKRSLSNFIDRVTGFPPVVATRWKILSTTESIFFELESLLQSAKKTIHMEFYIWNSRGRVEAIHAALLEAVQKGVQVRILVDSFGSDSFLDSDRAKELKEAGCEIGASMRIRLAGNRWDLRNHRKLVVVDGNRALTGSFNLVDPVYFKTNLGLGSWVDAMMLVEGGVALGLNGVFLQDWMVEQSVKNRPAHLWELPAPPTPAEETTPDPEATATFQVLPSGPGIYDEVVHQIILTSIFAAQDTIHITTPYFIPSDSIVQALISASYRGVDTYLVIPEKSDSRVAAFAGQSRFEELLTAGVRIFPFRGGLLHTKCITIDTSVALFGTVNLDMRSIWLNSEVTLVAYDEDVTREVTLLQEGYREDCEELTLEQWNARHWGRKGAESVTRLLGPVL